MKETLFGSHTCIFTNPTHFFVNFNFYSSLFNGLCIARMHFRSHDVINREFCWHKRRAFPIPTNREARSEHLFATLSCKRWDCLHDATSLTQSNERHCWSSIPPGRQKSHICASSAKDVWLKISSERRMTPVEFPNWTGHSEYCVRLSSCEVKFNHNNNCLTWFWGEWNLQQQNMHEKKCYDEMSEEI